MGTRPDFMNLYAKQVAGMPEDWRWFKWEATGPMGTDAPIAACGHLLTGAVVPNISRGKRKGQPNWRARERSQDTRLAFSAQSLLDFISAWETENDLCSECGGDGQEFASWDHIEGVTYRPCRRCKATGKPQHALAA